LGRTSGRRENLGIFFMQFLLNQANSADGGAVVVGVAQEHKAKIHGQQKARRQGALSGQVVQTALIVQGDGSFLERGDGERELPHQAVQMAKLFGQGSMDSKVILRRVAHVIDVIAMT